MDNKLKEIFKKPITKEEQKIYYFMQYKKETSDAKKSKILVKLDSMRKNK